MKTQNLGEFGANALNANAHETQSEICTKTSGLENGPRREFVKNSAKVAGIAMLASTLPLMAQTKGKTMQFTPTTQANHSKLFGVASSGLAKTDPEFIEIYANFAFDEVFAQSPNIDLQTRLKLILGALVAVQGLNEFKVMLTAALKNGVSPVEVKEILYQSTAYIGIGKSMDFIIACNEVFKARGVKLPLDPQQNVARQNRQDWGLNIQRQFFGEAIDKGNAAAPDDEKHIRRFLSANCFGDYYTRSGLELKFRELLTFVILTSLGGADAQVRAHIQGNLNIGHDRAYLIEVVTALVPYIGYPRSLNALAAIDELTLNKEKK